MLPANCRRNVQAVLSVRGKKIEEEMMRKSRHWDLWMNSGEVDIYDTPMLFIALSSDPALLTAGDFPGDIAPWKNKLNSSVDSSLLRMTPSSKSLFDSRNG